MASNTYTWTAEKIFELIDLYEERLCLYDTKHKDYFNRDLRGKALAEIATAVEFPGKRFTFSRLRGNVQTHTHTLWGVTTIGAVAPPLLDGSTECRMTNYCM